MADVQTKDIVASILSNMPAEKYTRYLIEQIEVANKELQYALESEKPHLVGLHAARIHEYANQLDAVHKWVLQNMS